MASEESTAKIKADLETAMKERLRGTPTFLMHGKKYLGRIPESALNNLIGRSNTGPRVLQNRNNKRGE
jgi:protein-disulfide isomerase